MLATAPGSKMPPVGGIGFSRIGGACGLDVTPGTIGEVLQVGRRGAGHGGGNAIASLRAVRLHSALLRIDFAVPPTKLLFKLAMRGQPIVCEHL